MAAQEVKWLKLAHLELPLVFNRSRIFWQTSLFIFLLCNLIVHCFTAPQYSDGLDLFMMRATSCIPIYHILGLAIGWLKIFPSSILMSVLANCPSWISIFAVACV
jgi:hypothetical protein